MKREGASRQRSDMFLKYRNEEERGVLIAERACGMGGRDEAGRVSQS